MNKGLRVALIAAALLAGAAALLWTGFFLGRNTWSMGGFPGAGMMTHPNPGGRRGYRPWRGHMETGRMGWERPLGRRGMMGRFGGESSVDPLTVDETREAVASYLDSIQTGGLVLEEIMIFDNHAYAIVVEERTGIGAFELLVDPATGAVYPEHGPNMMWNLKYGMMRGTGMMGARMMGGMYGSNPGELSVSPDEALQAAQQYLDEYAPGTMVSDEITAFYGYYTIDVERDDEITGMVSVNGFTSQVFPHTWHGEFIEMHHEE